MKGLIKGGKGVDNGWSDGLRDGRKKNDGWIEGVKQGNQVMEGEIVGRKGCTYQIARLREGGRRQWNENICLSKYVLGSLPTLSYLQ